MSFVFAVDLGGTKTAVAQVEETGRISNKTKIPAAHTFDETIAQVVDLLPSGARAAGVIVPGIYNPRSGTAWSPNLWDNDFHSLRDALEQRLGVPVAIGNDRTAYVIAEQWLGVARGMSDVVFVAVGTGIGVGVIAGGRVLEGAHGIAGAAGWMVLGNSWKNDYNAVGGWEFEAAGPSVARRAGMKTAEDAAAAARRGDPAALTIFRETADTLALGVANLISLFDPEIVVLGGGLMQASDLMIDRIRMQAIGWTQPVAAKLVRIEMTALNQDAGLFGAAKMAWNQTV